MIQPLTGVNYPHFALFRRESLTSKYYFFFFASSAHGIPHLHLSESRVISDIAEADRKSSGSLTCISVVCYGPVDDTQVFLYV